MTIEYRPDSTMTFVADRIRVRSGATRTPNDPELAQQPVVMLHLDGRWAGGADDHIDILAAALDLQCGAARVGLSIVEAAHQALTDVAKEMP